MKRTVLALAALFAVVWAVSGCETAKGAGRDIQNTGANIGQGFNSSSNADMGNSSYDNQTGMGAGTAGNTSPENSTGMGTGDTGTGTDGTY